MAIMHTAGEASQAKDHNAISGRQDTGMADYLAKRRSLGIKKLGEPGPGDAELEEILATARRVPDHGKLAPWYFVVFKGDARAQAGEILRRAWLEEQPRADEEKLAVEAARFTRAPVVVMVVSRLRPGKHPLWEQILSAGALCYNLCLTANAHGFATNWVTEWYAYNETFRAEMGLDDRDHIAGFVYMGTAAEGPKERSRPQLSTITTWWSPGAALNKGDSLEKSDMDLPAPGFKLSGHND